MSNILIFVKKVFKFFPDTGTPPIVMLLQISLEITKHVNQSTSSWEPRSV